MILFQKYLKTTSFIALSCGFIFSASNAHAESFRDALTAALQYHPSVEAAQAARQNVKDQKVEEWAAQYPEINVNATAGRVYGDNATSRGLAVTRGDGYSYLWEGSAGLTQKIFDGFETKEKIAAATDRYRSADLEVIDIRENLALQTARAYFDVMRSKEALDMIIKHNKQINDYRARINMMVDEGASDQAELKLAEDITILLDNIYAEYKSQYMVAEATYEQLTGERPTGQMMLPEWDRAYLPAALDDAVIVLESHPSIEAADYLIKASAHDVDAEKAGFYPDINGELFYLKKDLDDIIGGEVVDARAVVKMSWNFSTGGAQYAKVRQRQSSKFEAEARKKEVQRQLKQDLEQSWIEYQTATTILNNMTRRRDINKELFNTNKNQFDGAQIRLLQVMQSENQYFQTRLEYINSKYRQKLSELGVLASMGHLQQAMEIQVNDPEFTYKSPFRFDDD